MDHDLLQIARVVRVHPHRDHLSHVKFPDERGWDRKDFIHFIGLKPRHTDFQTNGDQRKYRTSTFPRDMIGKPEDSRFSLPARCLERVDFLLSLRRIPDQDPVQGGDKGDNAKQDIQIEAIVVIRERVGSIGQNESGFVFYPLADLAGCNRLC